MKKDEYTLNCPHCGNELQMTDLMRTRLNESLREENRRALNEALENQRKAIEEEHSAMMRGEIEKAINEQTRMIEKQRTELEFLRETERKKAEEDAETQKVIYLLKKELMEKETVMRRKLAESIEETYNNARKDVESENEKTVSTLKKQLQDVTKINNDLKQKLEQGSQQLQGEISELMLEDCLRTEFPFDDIVEIPKGRSGADIIQTVCSTTGKRCGKIVWESKNVKQWNNGFIPKLRNDLQQENGDVAILVSNVFGKEMAEFTSVDGVWLVRPSNAMSMARIMRDNLIRISEIQYIAERRDSIQGQVFELFTSQAFRNRMMDIGLKYRALEREITKTKDSMERHWKAQRKLIDELVGSTNEILGDVDSVMALTEPNSIDRLEENVQDS